MECNSALLNSRNGSEATIAVHDDPQGAAIPRPPKSRRRRNSGLHVVLVVAALHYLDIGVVDGATITEDTLAASVNVDRKILSPGDRIEIHGILKNTSAGSLVISRDTAPHPMAHVRMETADGAPLKNYILLMGDPRPYDLPTDFVELKSGDELPMAFHGTLREKTIRDLMKGGNVQVNGLFLDFGVSAILIPGKGEYRLRFRIEVSRGYSEEVERTFGFRNVWYGEVRSDPLRVMIR